MLIRDADTIKRVAALRPHLREHLAKNFSAFVRNAWRVLHPTAPLIWSWTYDYLCELLTQVKNRQLTRLILNIPPRTGKSTIVSILFPVWCWTTEPDNSFLVASHTLDLSVEHSMQRRRVLQSRWFESLWGGKFRLTTDCNQAAQFTNTAFGSMIATSVGANVLGRGGNTLLVDDPLTATQALSDTQRNAANAWFDNTFCTRLNDPASGAIIVIMQRLHELDLTGYLMETQPGRWTLVKIPLEAEVNETWNLPISGRIVTRNAGEVLMPERFPPAIVEEHRARRLEFAAQFQQRPSPLEGNLIRKSDISYYGGIDPRTGVADEPLPASFDRKIISVDCSFKSTSTSDYVAIGVIGVVGRKRYVLNVVNQRLDAAATEIEIRRQHDLYNYVRAILIEDAANGSAVIERLKRNVPAVVAIKPQGGKLARLHAVVPEWQARDWYVSRNAAWTQPFIEQLIMFPNGRNDDMVDMMTQAAAWLLQTPTGGIGVWHPTSFSHPNGYSY